jgi:murein DD-endopeptidase MepM/ murein hydrolase activator NlpD
LTDILSRPPVREKQKQSFLRRLERLSFIIRSSRFWSISLILILLIVSALYWHRSQKRSSAGRQAISRQTIIPASISPPPFKEIIGVFRPNQTITQALSQHGISDDMIRNIVDCARPAYNLAKVKASRLYWLCVTQEGKFRNFRYIMDEDRYLTIYHDTTNDRLVSEVKNFEYEMRVESVSAGIESSLFAAVEEIGEKDSLAMEMSEIFGSDIDFNTDIQKGDSFRVLVEKKYLNGQLSGYGAIQAASFSNSGKTFMGFRFTDENGKPAYYAPDGKSLKKSFLKSPLKFSRITSRFSYARMHPVLKVLRPHLGVDYAAAIGTPVHAVGSGVVNEAGWSGGSGRMVKLHHVNGYVTMYLHLSRIAVKPGAHVEQGQLIGNVGSSGISTGPHLDFRVYRNGKAINPLKVVFPPGAPVPERRMDQFAAVRDSLIPKITGDLRASK